MTLSDLIFLSLVLGLPIIVSLMLFRNEPRGRAFLATWVLAVIGSSFLFVTAAFLLTITEIGGLGMFDGIIEFVVSVPVALFVGLAVRRLRQPADL
ncbi:hypothetical protein FSZ31_02325 [Sphingorhabdus soli]|uniref:Uncharacterized protein n=1 Tax=Flavisphingopyxis soli TaxID=2601267 RepID=A0A5C6UN77_9SPHN|nr:hypothetical protein [Sphingorhabdus soli]TXC73601.1 hypothetical protein FSZ31_02325 [Sphingorhabdus soli]